MHKTYCRDKSGKQTARLYTYAVSLGANILGLYLQKESEKAKEYVHAAMLYGTPWSIADGVGMFYGSGLGFYAWVIGMNLSRLIRTYQLPKLRQYMSMEDYKYYSEFFENNWDGLRGIDIHVYPRMFGYKDVKDYY